MKVAIIQRTWVDHSDHRLDANPYTSGSTEARLRLRALRAKKQPLSELTKDGPTGIFHAGREGRTYVTDPRYGVPFLGSTDILASDLSWQSLLAKKQVEGNPKFTIQEGWTLITRSGTIGRMAFARASMAGMACSEHVMRVVPDKNKVRPGYLYAFLASRFGVPMIISGTYGAIIQHIEPQHIVDLPVPRFIPDLEEQVHAHIAEASSLRDHYQKNIVSATSDLFSSVGLQDITSTRWHNMGADLGFTCQDASSSSLRSLNYGPRFRKLHDRLSSVPHMPLGEICEGGVLRRGERFKRVDCDPEYGVRLVGQKELFWVEPEGRWIATRYAPEDIFVRDETILVAARGTLGENEVYCRAELVTGTWLENAYAEDFLRIQSGRQGISGALLFAFLRSETAFRYLRSISTGSKQQDLHRHFLAQLPVPLPPIEVRRQVETLIRDAYAARHRASALEQTAIKLVEEAIEGNH